MPHNRYHYITSIGNTLWLGQVMLLPKTALGSSILCFVWEILVVTTNYATCLTTHQLSMEHVWSVHVHCCSLWYCGMAILWPTLYTSGHLYVSHLEAGDLWRHWLFFFLPEFSVDRFQYRGTLCCVLWSCRYLCYWLAVVCGYHIAGIPCIAFSYCWGENMGQRHNIIV